MKFSGVKRRLKVLFGWTMPAVTALSSVWSPQAHGTTVVMSPDTKLLPEPSPVTFANPLNQNAVNIFAGHSSHRSHSSHSSHSSHYSSGGGYSLPSTPAPSPAPPTPQTPPAVPAPRQSPSAPQKPTVDQLKAMVMRLQLELQIKQLYDGPISGVLDEKTTGALKMFQTQNGIKPTGHMDTETLTALGISVP